eukprot:scaffold127529_cov54-Phaeocystis_antarctica.AAC.2
MRQRRVVGPPPVPAAPKPHAAAAPCRPPPRVAPEPEAALSRRKLAPRRPSRRGLVAAHGGAPLPRPATSPSRLAVTGRPHLQHAHRRARRQRRPRRRAGLLGELHRLQEPRPRRQALRAAAAARPADGARAAARLVGGAPAARPLLHPGAVRVRRPVQGDAWLRGGPGERGQGALPRLGARVLRAVHPQVGLPLLRRRVRQPRLLPVPGRGRRRGLAALHERRFRRGR